jgi:hypothetical protein
MTRSAFGWWLLGVAWTLATLAAAAPVAAKVPAFERQVMREVRAQLRRDAWKAAHPKSAGACPDVPEVPPWPTGSTWPLWVTLRNVDEGATGAKAWVVFDLKVGLSPLLPALRVEKLVLDGAGRLDTGALGKLSWRHPARPPFPLGTSGLALYGYEITLHPQQHRASLETDVSTLPGDPRLLRLHGKFGVVLPQQKITFAGRLLVGEFVLGTITDAELSAAGLEGTLTIPGDPNAPVPLTLPRTKAHFYLDHAGLRATGDLSFLKVFHKQLELSLAWDGQCSLHSSSNLKLLGWQAKSALHTGVAPGGLYFHVQAVGGIDHGPLQHEVRLSVTAGSGP